MYAQRHLRDISATFARARAAVLELRAMRCAVPSPPSVPTRGGAHMTSAWLQSGIQGYG